MTTLLAYEFGLRFLYILGRFFRPRRDFPRFFRCYEVSNDHEAIAIKVGFECGCLGKIHLYVLHD